MKTTTLDFIKKIFLFIHQLPQNVLGFIIVFFTFAQKTDRDFEYVASTRFYFGVSLGDFIIFGNRKGSVTSYMHEYGHHRQSLYLGWLYLILVGLPSLCINLWDLFVHGNWSKDKRISWYYSRYPERWADELGLVERRI